MRAEYAHTVFLLRIAVAALALGCRGENHRELTHSERQFRAADSVWREVVKRTGSPPDWESDVAEDDFGSTISLQRKFERFRDTVVVVGGNVVDAWLAPDGVHVWLEMTRPEILAVRVETVCDRRVSSLFDQLYVWPASDPPDYFIALRHPAIAHDPQPRYAVSMENMPGSIDGFADARPGRVLTGDCVEVAKVPIVDDSVRSARKASP